MRIGQWELHVILSREFNKPENEQQPLRESLIDNQLYVHSVPNEEFFIRLRVYPDSIGRFPGQYLRVGLEINGQDVNYWKRLDLSLSPLQMMTMKEPGVVTFKGFQVGTNNIIPFRFSPPISHITNTSLIRFGTINLRVYSCKLDSGMISNRVNHTISKNQNHYSGLSINPLKPLSSKSNITPDTFNPLQNWTTISDVPIQTLFLKYQEDFIVRKISLEQAEKIQSRLDQEKRIEKQMINKIEQLTKKKNSIINLEYESEKSKLEKSIQDKQSEREKRKRDEEKKEEDEEEDFEIFVSPLKKTVPCLDLTIDDEEQKWKNETI